MHRHERTHKFPKSAAVWCKIRSCLWMMFRKVSREFRRFFVGRVFLEITLGVAGLSRGGFWRFSGRLLEVPGPFWRSRGGGLLEFLGSLWRSSWRSWASLGSYLGCRGVFFRTFPMYFPARKCRSRYFRLPRPSTSQLLAQPNIWYPNTSKAQNTYQM